MGVAGAKPVDPPGPGTAETLPRCGASVAALAWFYEGIRDAGVFRAQQKVDGLLDMRAALRDEAARRGGDRLDRLTALERARIGTLERGLNGGVEGAERAVGTLEAEVAECIVVFFERAD